jgi:hypothetical protein
MIARVLNTIYFFWSPFKIFQKDLEKFHFFFIDGHGS